MNQGALATWRQVILIQDWRGRSLDLGTVDHIGEAYRIWGRRMLLRIRSLLEQEVALLRGMRELRACLDLLTLVRTDSRWLVNDSLSSRTMPRNGVAVFWGMKRPCRVREARSVFLGILVKQILVHLSGLTERCQVSSHSSIMSR
jgi:hypothetical protein